MRAKRISVLVASAAVILALGGCSSAGTPSDVGNTSVIGGDYSSTTALLSALSAAGIPCSSPSVISGSKVVGAQSPVDCDSPDGSGSDSVASVFDTHADAQAYATNMLELTANDTSGSGTSIQVVVGANWVVNTVPPYGDEVLAHLGGSESTATAPTAAAPVTTAATSASPTPTPAAQITAPAAPATQPPQPAQTTAQQPQQGCYPRTNSGNCYKPGEYCRTSDHGASGIDGNGDAIQCEDNNGWRWERV
ncbi:MAG TPA: hypothetical protein VFN97_14155 [Actinospica sp.]|nr:hypothetical protein [Actinospica sp.]